MVAGILLKANTVSGYGTIVAGAVAFLYLIMIYYRKFSREDKNKKNFERIAKNLGLTIDRSSWADSPKIIIEATGKIRGIPVEIYTEESMRRRKSSIFYTTIRITLNKNRSAQFNLSNENVLHKIVRAVGINDTLTGYPEFDNAFVLNAENPEKMLKVFDEEMCTKFVENHLQFESKITASENLLIYKEQTLIDSPEEAERFEFIIELLVELAEKINAVAGKK